MATIPLLRTIQFVSISLVSLVVLGICAYIQYIITKYSIRGASLSFAPLGIGAACLTVISLPLFLVLDHFRRHVFTSMILFELIWFALLWVLWAGTAGDTVVTRSYYFSAGCIYPYPIENRVCYGITVVEALAVFNVFFAFVYFTVLLFFATINALRGKGVWTASVKEATIGLDQGASIPESHFNSMPATQYQNFGLYSPNFPSSYNGYLQQVSLPGPPIQSYNGLPQQVPLQGLPSQQFNTTLQQAFPNHFSAQTKQGNSRPSSSGDPQQQVQVHYPTYSSGIDPQDISSPALRNSAGGLQARASLSNGHPGLLAISQQQQWPSPQSASPPVPVYGVHQPIPV